MVFFLPFFPTKSVELWQASCKATEIDLGNCPHFRKQIVCLAWWRWVDLNYRSIGYEPIALTAEPHRRYYVIISKLNFVVKTFLKYFVKI